MSRSLGRAVLTASFSAVGLMLAAEGVAAQSQRPAQPATPARAGQPSQGARQTPPAQAAQGAGRTLRFGVPLTDSLTASLPRLSNRGVFRTYRINAKASKRYVITLESDAFDAYVAVMREVGGLTDQIASDDDTGGGSEGTNARLRFTPPADGAYIIVAMSFTEEGTGRYTLKVDENDPPLPPRPRAIEVGQRLEGNISNESAVDDESGHAYDLYMLHGTGQRVRIVMRSGAFDTFLRLTRITSSGAEEEVTTNDDGAGGTDSRIVAVLNGEYRLYARPLSENERGGYSIAVEEALPVKVQQRPIAIGGTAEGELSAGDPELDEGGYFHEYVVEAAAGDALRITLRSEAFDAYLRWGTKDGDTFSEVLSDDDSGGDLDSMLNVRVERAGRYVIRVSALGADGEGAYTLTVERR